MSEVTNDQHFLIDEKVIQSLLDVADLSLNDTVLEVGAGTGNITKELAKRVKKLIAVELDQELIGPLSHVRPLSKSSKEVTKNNSESKQVNIEIINADALKVINQRRDFTKIIGNIPYQISEALIQAVIKRAFIKSLTLIAPRSFALKAQEHAIFKAFFEIEIKEEVEKEAFNPPPDTRSVIVLFKRKSFDGNSGEQIIRSLYLQKDKQLKNGLREALIELYKLKNKPLTKKEASKLVDQIDAGDRDVLISRLPLPVFDKIAQMTV